MFLGTPKAYIQNWCKHFSSVFAILMFKLDDLSGERIDRRLIDILAKYRNTLKRNHWTGFIKFKLFYLNQICDAENGPNNAYLAISMRSRRSLHSCKTLKITIKLKSETVNTLEVWPKYLWFLGYIFFVQQILRISVNLHYFGTLISVKFPERFSSL